MGVITRPFELRSTLANPDAFIQRWFRAGGSDSWAGNTVNESTALNYTAFYAANLILSESVGQVPFGIFRQDDQGSEPAKDHPLWELLHFAPNEEQTAIEWRGVAQGHLGTWGNHYSQVIRDNRARVREIWPLLPNRMRVERASDESLRYVYTNRDGQTRIFFRDEILHLRGFGFDGLIGYNPVVQAGQAIGLGLATEEFGSRFFGNGAHAAGALQHPGTLGDEAFKNLKDSFKAEHQGLANANKPLILEEGMTWTQIGIPPEASQFLETRKFQVTEIARHYRIPPHMLMDLEKATFSNIEHQGIDFLVHTLLPWYVRWEQGIRLRLLSRSERQPFVLKHNVNGFLRGDTKTRFEAYATARNWGWMSVNDIRRLEDQNPIPDGDVYLQPLNMSEAGAPPAQPQASEPQRVNGAAVQ